VGYNPDPHLVNSACLRALLGAGWRRWGLCQLKIICMSPRPYAVSACLCASTACGCHLTPTSPTSMEEYRLDKGLRGGMIPTPTRTLPTPLPHLALSGPRVVVLLSDPLWIHLDALVESSPV